MWGVLIGVTALTLGIVVPAGVSLADLPGGCDFSPANNGIPNCSGPLSGSTFAGGDGNLLTSPTTFGSTDWQGVAGLNAGFDLLSGTGDNSLGKGSKEDDPNVNVVSGSIPPNKSDLTRFYEASEFSSVNSHNFLYLAWERTNVLGTANFDFEINQKTQPDMTTTGPKTLVRTAGDLLVTYDFDNGGGVPTIGLLRWLTSTTVPVVPGFATNVCLASNSFPCWGDKVVLDGTDSIAAVNNLGAVTDPLFPNSPNYINPVPALQFGETAIDLTAAGVFPSGTCVAFGSAFVRSRSSSAFTSEIKDFIAPIPINISNCGTVNIIKHTDHRGIDQNFSYTSTIPNPASGSTTPDCSLDSTPASFTLNDHAGVDPTAPITQGTDNTEHCANVPAGSYTVTEGALPGSNWSLDSLTCTATGTGSSGSQDGTNPAKANITLAPGGVVTCIYVNKLTDTTSMASAQTWLPNDSATVTAANGTALNGTLSTQLYTGDNCGVTSGAAVSGQLYTKTLTNATSLADRTVTSNNTTFTVTASGSVSWLVTFTSTDSNVTGSSHCEKTSLTITN
jgi:hypothetical protein